MKVKSVNQQNRPSGCWVICFGFFEHNGDFPLHVWGEKFIIQKRSKVKSFSDKKVTSRNARSQNSIKYLKVPMKFPKKGMVLWILIFACASFQKFTSWKRHAWEKNVSDKNVTKNYALQLLCTKFCQIFNKKP